MYGKGRAICDSGPTFIFAVAFASGPFMQIADAQMFIVLLIMAKTKTSTTAMIMTTMTRAIYVMMKKERDGVCGPTPRCYYA